MRELISHFRPRFKYEVSSKLPAITSHAGLALVRETLEKIGVIDKMSRFRLKQAGYGDEVILESLILLLASGGRSVSDWEYLKSEEGFVRMFGFSLSVDTLERYLRRLPLSVPDRTSSCGLVGFSALLEDAQVQVIREAWRRAGCPKKLTIDLDSSIFGTNKRDSLFCYEGFKAYQPMISYCPELAMVLAHEFRDGNVSPAEGYQRIVERCRKILPEVHFTVRADAAAYQNDFLEWMTKKQIRYYITARHSGSTDEWLKHEKHWKPLILDGINTGQEVAEYFEYPVSFANKKELHWRSRSRRYIATRIEKRQKDLFDNYIYQVIVTNAQWETPEQNLKMHRGRCGSVEHAHSQLKGQCGMDKMPANEFSVNAAWFSLGCLTHNILRFMQHFVLPESFKKLEIQTLRFRFLRGCAVVIKKARGTILRFFNGSPLYELFCKSRARLIQATA